MFHRSVKLVPESLRRNVLPLGLGKGILDSLKSKHQKQKDETLDSHYVLE